MKPNRLALALALAGAGCVDVDTDTGEGAPSPTVEFDPAQSIIPFPNNLVMNPATGKVNLPMQCNESPAQTAIRSGVLNTLDGFGTFKTALQVTLTEPPDPSTLGAVHLYRSDGAGGGEEIDVLVIPGTTPRYRRDCSAVDQVNSLTIIAVSNGVPIALPESSNYGLVVTDELRTESGAPFLPSFTWAFVRQAENPVTVENGVVVAERTPLDPSDPADTMTLLGVDLLWKAHTQTLGFLEAASGTTRDHFLVASGFRTQTVTRPLDPTVAGSPAATLPDAPLVGVVSVLAGQTPTQYLDARLPPGTCAAIGCASLGDIAGGALLAPNYQVIPTSGPPVPGAWTDPLAPAQQGDASALITAVFIPATTQPANGWPTVVFGHGLGSSKESLAVLAPSLARAGFASVAIDFVAHGSRAVKVSTAPEIGCAGTTTPGGAPQCYAPIFSSNLAGTRDNVRQTVLDLQTLVKSVRLCTTAAPCGPLAVDPDNVGYIGISLGGIIGSMVSAESEGLEAAVTNVAGAGLIDIIENTQTLAIKCSLVDSLIDAGVVTGDKWNLGMNTTTAACLSEEWKTQPSYRSFANVARWILDSSDPANYAAKLATRTTLLQEVIGDLVVPNIATDQLGALSGRLPAAADPATSAPPFPPSEAISTNPTQSKWITYTNLPPDAGSGFPGNTFQHASLLAPAASVTTPAGPDGQLGTARVQTDALYFLVQNIIVN
jgi:pimeloyl-ACP methyl ester carboxylesterase